MPNKKKLNRNTNFGSKNGSRNTPTNIQKSNAMWIYGKHSVKAVLQNPAREILRFILLDTADNLRVLPEAPSKIPEPEYVDRNYFSALFGNEAAHQGCAVLVKKLPKVFLEDLVSVPASNSRIKSVVTENPPIILLDQVADPQNIGSILRAAAVFGARAVVMTENHSPEITPAIAKAASGALEKIPLVMVVNLVQSINFLKKNGYWVVGLDEKSEKNLDELDLRSRFAFIVGNEGNGMRRLSKESCDFIVKLPGPSKTFTTLNAAQAATVTLYESCRQRTK